MPLAHDPLLCSLPIAARETISAHWQALETRAKDAELRLRLVEQELRLLRLAKYGPKSEQLSDGQLALLELA